MEELITYNQLLDHLEQADAQDNSVDWELYRVKPSLVTKLEGSKYNVQVEWETGEITIEPHGVIAADDPITSAVYAKEKNLYNLDGWKRFKNIIKKDKMLSRTIKQSIIRQERHSQKFMFGYLIPRSYTEALEFDKADNNSKWYDATRTEMDHLYHVFQKHEKATFDRHREVINSPPG